MTFFTDKMTIVSFGNFAITIGLVCMLVGIGIGTWLMIRVNRKHGYPLDSTLELLALVVVGGILFGRIIYVMENWNEYSKYIPYIFAINDGGFSPLGILIGTCLATFAYGKERSMSALRLSDSLSPIVLLFVTLLLIPTALNYPKMWFFVVINLLGFLGIWFEVRKYRNEKRRGEPTIVTFLWFGISILGQVLMKVDPTASTTLGSSFVSFGIGLGFYIYILRRKPKKPVILFDLDGTLMDSRRMVLLCFAYLYKKYSHIKHFTPEVQRSVFGPSLLEIMPRLFPDQDPQLMVDEYRKYQSSFSWSKDVSLFPSTKQVLEHLWMNEYKLGIVSSRMTESCESWIRQLRLSNYFGVIIGRDQVKVPKPSPEGILYACKRLKTGHDDCIYIGDNPTDIMAAKAAGCYAIAFASNQDKLPKIKQCKPNAIISSMSDLLLILENHHSWTYERM